MMSSSPTICLNMIVKNESKNLPRLFDSIISIIDSYCICDTGSTDNTKEVIENYFREKNIPGKIVEKEFVDFGTNRTYALHAAKGMADYALLLDADMVLSIGPDFNKTNLTDYDVYSILQGSEAFNYYNIRIISLKLDVDCVCPTHEYYSIKTNPHKHIKKDKNFLFIKDIGDGGCKSNKFQRDIQLLSNGLITDPNNARYHFYLANSYFDTQQYENAIKHYKRHVELNAWDQEKFYSYYKLGKCYKALNDEANMVYCWTKGYSYRHTRAETLYELINYYRLKGEHKLCQLYYEVAKNIPYPTNDTLFIHKDVYDYKLDEEYTIFSFYNGNRNIDVQMRKLVEDGRANMGLLISNSQFYTENKLKLIMNANGEYNLVDNVFSFPSKEERKQHKKSKNILFFTGYSDRPWNKTYATTHSLGGSEKAVVYLSSCFPNDYTIYVAGGVRPEVVDNIIYVNNDKLAELLTTTQFHTIICSRYVGFLEKYADFLKFYQLYLWAHDTCLIRTDTHLTTNQVLDKWNDHIDGCVCLTNWHAEQFKNLYPTLSTKIHVINNGIVPELFAADGEKIKNRFIYSSRSERGLERLIALWPNILERNPDATLVVFGYNKFPLTTLDQRIATEMLKYKDSITHLGQLNANQMYDQMRIAEYWLYPTNWCETSCITALEMLASGVICLYYPVAGLVNTMSTYGIPISQGDEVNTIECLTDEKKNELRIKGKEYAMSCSWKNRSENWCSMLGFVKCELPIKIINLERRPDRKENMIREFEKQGIYLSNEHFIKAVDGKELKLTEELYELFKGNNFNYRRGIIGCALSHFSIMNELHNSTDLTHLIVFEDDVKLTNEIKYSIEIAQQFITKNQNADIVFLGYSDEKYKQMCSNRQELKIIEFKKNINYDGGLFGYLITKSGASKIINNIKTNGIQIVFDYFAIYTPNLNIYTFNHHVITTDIHRPFTNSIVDTNIQDDFETIQLDNKFFNDTFVFIPHTDQEGNDLYNNTFKNNVSLMLLRAIEDKNVVAVNSYGWFKKCITNLLITECYKEKTYGIYIKTQAYLDYCNRKLVEDNDLELITSQCNVSREKAQETLIKNNGDVVNSIIELTSSN